MTDVEIRPLRLDDDMDAQVDLGQRAFGMAPPDEWASWRERAELHIRQGSFLGAFVSGRPAGAAAIYDMRQWWHGRPVPMAGVASVKVAPEYRGRGIGKRLMTAILGLIAERGYPVSALYPATMPIYRSLGWEVAGALHEAVIPARELRSLIAPDAAVLAGGAAPDLAGGLAPDRAAAAGEAELRRAGPEDAAAVNSVVARAHEAARDCGPVTWDAAQLARALTRNDMYTYLCDDGFVAYGWGREGGELHVDRLYGASAKALRALWAVVASHASIADRVRVQLSPSDPLWWLTRERDIAITRRSLWMLRLVDAPAAIAARGFPPGVNISVPLLIADEARQANSGRWELTVSGGKGSLARDRGGTAAGAAGTLSGVPAPGARGALALGARGLAALYAGTPVATLRLAGLAAGGSPDGDAVLDAAFAATAFMLDDF